MFDKSILKKIIFIYNIFMNIGKFEKVTSEQFLKDSKDFLGIENDNYDFVSIPKRATKGSAGYDFVCPFDIEIKPNQLVKIPTGIRCYMEKGYVLNIYPRSSLGFKYQMMLANTVGIIDADYYNALNQGHIIIAIINKGEKTITLYKGDRFVQGVFLKFYTVSEEEVETTRTGGLGSSN